MRLWVIIAKKRTDKDLFEAITNGAVFTKQADAVIELEHFDPEREEVVEVEVIIRSK